MHEKLNFCLSKDIFDKCKSPKEFIEYCAYTKNLLKIKDMDKEEQKQLYANNKKLFKAPIEPYEYVFSYVENVPSDYYIYNHPTPKVRVQKINIKKGQMGKQKRYN